MFRSPDSNNAGPFGAGPLGWIAIGVLLGLVLLITSDQAPYFALGGVGAGIGVIAGAGFSTFKKPKA